MRTLARVASVFGFGLARNAPVVLTGALQDYSRMVKMRGKKPLTELCWNGSGMGVELGGVPYLTLAGPPSCLLLSKQVSFRRPELRASKMVSQEVSWQVSKWVSK